MYVPFDVRSVSTTNPSFSPTQYCSYPSTEFSTQVQNYLPRYKTYYLGKNFLPENVAFYTDTALPTREWKFLPGHEIFYQSRGLHTQVSN
jgi:hypothetical protein